MNRRLVIAAAVLLGTSAPLSAQSVTAGITAWQHSDYEGAVRIWRPLAEKGDPDAQFNLAQAYRLGRGVPINLAMAQTWLKRAALQGHVDAETTLGLLMFQNNNRSLGIYWLKAAAAKNDPRALLVYGTALFNGDGVKADPALGYSYVKRAAAQGLAPAKDTLAQIEASMTPDELSKLVSGNGTAKLAKSTPSAKTPAKTTHAPPPAKARLTPATAERVPVKPAKPATGNWRIQLGAFGERSSAEAQFRKVAGRSVLAGRSAAYVRAGAVIRLQVGPFESRAAAQKACSALKVSCFPVPAT